MRWAWQILIAASLFAVSLPTTADESYSLYLVRHAEKVADGSRDPALTGPGSARAERLAVWLSPRGLEAIWSSDYIRTRDTAAPSARSLGLEVQIYDPANLAGLALQLREAGQNALVVGHSNTTPQLGSPLCGCQVDAMPESEYDRLIRVVVDGNSARLDTSSQDALTQ